MWDIRVCNIPFEKVLREGLISEIPIRIDQGGHFHGVSAGEDGGLEYSTSVDESVAGQSVYVDRVAEVWLEELVDRMESAQLSVRRDREWLDHGVGVQPVADELVEAGIVDGGVCFC